VVPPTTCPRPDTMSRRHLRRHIIMPRRFVEGLLLELRARPVMPLSTQQTGRGYSIDAVHDHLQYHGLGFMFARGRVKGLPCPSPRPEWPPPPRRTWDVGGNTKAPSPSRTGIRLLVGSHSHGKSMSRRVGQPSVSGTCAFYPQVAVDGGVLLAQAASEL
jgi:hypothetical protein